LDSDELFFFLPEDLVSSLQTSDSLHNHLFVKFCWQFYCIGTPEKYAWNIPHLLIGVCRAIILFVRLLSGSTTAKSRSYLIDGESNVDMEMKKGSF